MRKRYTGQEPWYEAPDSTAHDLVFKRVHELRAGDLSTYRDRVLRNLQLYAGSLNVNGTDEAVYKVRYNLIRSITDTGVSVMVAAKTLPFAQTRGASWDLRRKALTFNRVLQQQFPDIGVFNESQRVIEDALKTGLGVLKFFQDPNEDGATAGCERGLPLSIVWDPAEASNGRVTQIWEVRLVNRDHFAALHPEHAEKIYDAAGPSSHDRRDFQLSRTAKANQCVVIEAWKLPTSAKAKDGKHGIYVSTGTIYSGAWSRTRFPFAFLKGWAPNSFGFTGASIPELVEPAQARIEELHDFVEACQNLGSVPRVFVDGYSEVEPLQINNLPMQLIRVKGGKQIPVFQTFDATPHDLENSVAMIREQTRDEFGFSQTQVSGQTADGITSAVGMRAREDIQSKRHVLNLRYIEQYYLDCSQCIIDINDDIVERDPSFAIDREARGAWLESSEWKKVSLNPGEAKLAVLPVSALVGSVSSQYDITQTWVDRGWCTPETAKMLAGQPDTEGQADEDTEDERFAHYLCERILDGELITVDTYLDVETLLTVARSEYLRAQRLSAPEPILGEFRRVLEVCKARVDASVAAQQAAAAPAATPAGGRVVPDAAQAA